MVSGLAVSARPALAQGEGESPPIIQSVSFEIARNQGVDPYFGPFDPNEPFDPASELAREGDWILITVVVSDADLPDEELFVRKTSTWLPWPASPSPEPPQMPGDTPNFHAPLYRSVGAGTATIYFRFLVPQWLGANQARLRGVIDWDVRWEIQIEVSNSESPGEEDPVDVYSFVLYAVEQVAFRPPNPPPFADAGSDRVVPRGMRIILDGSRTYDYYNVGFDVTNENIFEKDTLTFTWEWISGPVRVDPEQDDPHSPYAIVQLDVPDPNQPYVYRLLVDDNVNALPSSDTVQITVLDELPPETPPVAIIEGPAHAQPVGSVVTLVSRSYDPDRPDDPNGLLLEYRWQQTSELGEPLAPEEFRDAFQPLTGLTEKQSSWQALTPGTFYFRLLVSDGQFLSNATFAVEVIERETSAVTETADSAADKAADSGSTPDELAPTLPAGACGAGFLPLAAAPLAYCLVARRRG